MNEAIEDSGPWEREILAHFEKLIEEWIIRFLVLKTLASPGFVKGWWWI